MIKIYFWIFNNSNDRNGGRFPEENKTGREKQKEEGCCVCLCIYVRVCVCVCVCMEPLISAEFPQLLLPVCVHV